MSLLSNLDRWLKARPRKLGRRPDLRKEGGEFFLTGPTLIQRIVRAIELDQSVLLTGPRGCGKTYCIKQAVKAAAKMRLVPEEYVFLQGNKEFPRDYLAEDEIIFETVTVDKKEEVRPSTRSAPLFRFAEREEEGARKPKKGEDGVVECKFEDVKNRRFVLLLDEINRFSDGVLDSLLSVLEEREAVLGGEVFRIPVVVLMTMNPPGYDSSARPLSPPLAARISKSYRLSTPDLDTMSDYIVLERWRKAEEHYAGSVGDAKKARGRGATRPGFPEEDMVLIRCACLVSICLWGLSDEELRSHEYLTEETRELLDWVARMPEVKAAMQAIAGLARFGPDGRAAADWVVAAIGLAIDEASREARGGSVKAKLEIKHLEMSGVEALSHKIYDNFNPASNPGKTREKEAAVQQIIKSILNSHEVRTKVARDLDQDDTLLQKLGWWAKALPRRAAKEAPARVMRKLCIEHRVTSREDWQLLADVEANGKTNEEIETALVAAGIIQLAKETGEDPDDRRWSFCDPSWDGWFRGLAATASSRCRDKVLGWVLSRAMSVGAIAPHVHEVLLTHLSVRELWESLKASKRRKPFENESGAPFATDDEHMASVFFILISEDGKEPKNEAYGAANSWSIGARQRLLAAEYSDVIVEVAVAMDRLLTASAEGREEYVERMSAGASPSVVLSNRDLSGAGFDPRLHRVLGCAAPIVDEWGADGFRIANDLRRIQALIPVNER